MPDTPKVTVYIPTFNYGSYLREAVQSVLIQNYENWELIIIDDGSADETPAILAEFEENPKIRIIFQENHGLTRTNNKAIEMYRGEYIMRLDADDYLDENALLVLSNILDTKPDVALVFPDYFVVSKAGDLIRLERRSKVYEEDELLDLPSHAACAMIRKTCLIALGGYNEDIPRQDGYDLWLRLIQKYQIYNVNLPLFYYRRHPGSMSSRLDKLLRTRQKVKREFVAKLDNDLPKVLAIIPTRDDSTATEPPLALRQLAGKTVLSYSINAALESGVLDRIVVTSDNQPVLECAQRFDGVEAITRSKELCKPHSPIEPTVFYILSELEKREGYVPDAVMLLFVVSPLREARHIQKSVDTLRIFDCDSVVSVYNDDSYFYRRGKFGLEPIIKERKLRIERDVLYADNAAIVLSWLSAINPRSFVGRRASHILMTPEESFQIDTDFEFWVVEQILKRRIAEHEEQIF